MSTLDSTVMAWLVVCAAASSGAHVFAHQQTPREAGRERRIHFATAILTAVYCLGYVAVLTGQVQILAWSSFFRGVSLLAFPLVWITPAVMTGQRWRRDRLAARELVARAHESRGYRHRHDAGAGG